MVLDEDIIVEIVRPGTGEPVALGETGEVVVTTLTPEYPLIRFATGDLSAILPEPVRSARTNYRIKGWLGRADQTTKIRGMFVHPEQIADVVRRHPSISRARLVVERANGADAMTLLVETGEPADLARIAETVQAADAVALSGQPSAEREPAGGRQADRGPPAARLKGKPKLFIKRSYFLQTKVPIRAPYGSRKVYPYRFVPQTSYSAASDGRWPSGSGFPLRSRLFMSPRLTDFAPQSARFRSRHSSAELVAEDLACRRGERLVFAGLSFRLPPGGALVLTGANGSGKSSLLRLVAGLLTPAAGRLLWGAISDRRRYRGHRARLHYVGHLDALKPALTPRETLAFWAALRGCAPVMRGAAIDEALAASTSSDRRLAVPLALGRTAAPRRAGAPAGGAGAVMAARRADDRARRRQPSPARTGDRRASRGRRHGHARDPRADRARRPRRHLALDGYAPRFDELDAGFAE